MIRIIAELRDGAVVRDVASGPISGMELMDMFVLCDIWYGSRPFEIRLEADSLPLADYQETK